MRQEAEKEKSKRYKTIKNLLNKKKIIIGFAIVILVFLVVTITIILKSESDISGAVALKPNNVDNGVSKVWNDVISSVKPTHDGGYIGVGYTTDGNLNDRMCTDVYEEDALIIKYNEKGEITWKKYLNARDNDKYNSVQQTSDGGYIAVGYIVGGGDHLTGKSAWNDAIIAKYNASGNLVWDKKYGIGSMNEEFDDVRQTSDGGYIVVGGERKDYDEYDALLVKYDKSGQLKWTKIFEGKGYDYFNSVQQTKDGGYIAIGTSDSNTKVSSDAVEEDQDALIVKYDENGKMLWKNIFVTDNDGYYNYGKQTYDGGYIMAGFCFSLGDYSQIIVKYSKTGSVLWHKEFPGIGHNSFFSVEETEDVGYIAVGHHSNLTDGGQEGSNEEIHAIIMKFDKLGNEVEKNILKDSLNSSFSSVERTSDGNYIVIGDLCSKDEGFNGKSNKTVIIQYNNNLQAIKQLVLQKVIDYQRNN